MHGVKTREKMAYRVVLKWRQMEFRKGHVQYNIHLI